MPIETAKEQRTCKGARDFKLNKFFAMRKREEAGRPPFFYWWMAAVAEDRIK
jgi:hypothetical protein